MPKRKITPSVWEALLSDYQEWNPAAPDAISVGALIARHGVSKQAFYNELRRRGIPTKQVWHGQPSDPGSEASVVQQVLIEALTEARLRNKVLERRVDDLERQLSS